MSLREDFKDISYEMARFIEKEIEKIKAAGKKQIEAIEEEIEQRINQDTLKMELKTIQKKEYELNKIESDKITKINQTIAEKKIKSITDFLKILQKEVRKRVEEKKDLYMYFLIERIQSLTPLINQNATIHFDKHDLEYAKKFQFLEKLGEKKEFFTISEEPIETGIGFKILSDDGEYVIDYTFSALIEKYYQDLEIRFMQIFPVFEENIRNAMEIDKEKHGKAKRYDI